MVVGAILNSAAFVGGSYLAKKYGSKYVDEEKIRHDKAIEAFQQAQANYRKKREEYQDWLNTQYVMKKNAEDVMGKTDMSFKLFARAHPEAHKILRREPEFSDYYKPSASQKNYEMVFVGGSMLASGYITSKFL